MTTWTSDTSDNASCPEPYTIQVDYAPSQIPKNAVLKILYHQSIFHILVNYSDLTPRPPRKSLESSRCDKAEILQARLRKIDGTSPATEELQVLWDVLRPLCARFFGLKRPYGPQSPQPLSLDGFVSMPCFFGRLRLRSKTLSVTDNLNDLGAQFVPLSAADFPIGTTWHGRVDMEVEGSSLGVHVDDCVSASALEMLDLNAAFLEPSNAMVGFSNAPWASPLVFRSWHDGDEFRTELAGYYAIKRSVQGGYSETECVESWAAEETTVAARTPAPLFVPSYGDRDTTLSDNPLDRFPRFAYAVRSHTGKVIGALFENVDISRPLFDALTEGVSVERAIGWYRQIEAALFALDTLGLRWGAPAEHTLFLGEGDRVVIMGLGWRPFREGGYVEDAARVLDMLSSGIIAEEA